MKKTLIILFTIFLLCGTLLYAVDKEKIEREVAFNDVSPTIKSNFIVPQNRDLWDILNTFYCSAVSHAGIETDGINIYTATWNAGTFSRYDMDGVHLGNFTVAGVVSMRDMAYDGTYFYGSPASLNIYIMDLANETLIGTIPVSCAGVTGVRHIAFDPELDGGNGGFWVGNWFELGAITMSGAQIHANMAHPGMLYGSAYDEWTADGPYLWLFSQEGGAILYQFDIAAQAVTGVTHNASDIPGFNLGTAGGLATYVNDDDLFVMLANIQQSLNLVGVYEIAITADPLAPGAPTGVVVTPDAGGALEADIDWVCPTLQFNGDPLTDLDEMRVYRGEDLIYTDTTPVIGGSGSYTDVSVPLAGQYVYKVVGYNDFDEGAPATESVWVGEDVPAAITDLLLENFSTDTDLIAHLSWVNPTVGLHGGPYNEPILGYHVLRSDGVPLELTGILTEWTDDTIPAIDYYSYSVTPYNSTGDGATAVSNTCLITTENVMFADDFSGGLTNWQLENHGQPGGEWTIYAPPYPSGYQMPPTSAGNVCSADADEVYPIDSELILAIPLDCSEMIDVILEFDSDFNMIDAHDWGYVDVSANGGTTWTNVLTYHGVDYPAVHEMLNISEYVAGFTDVLIKFHSVQPGWDWWWTIDNVMVSGTEGGLSAIVGTVTDAVTTNPIVGAIVDFNGTTQTTDASGYYEFATVFPGTYTLICTADGYYNGEEESIVLSGQTTTTNFAMDPHFFGALDGTVTDADTGLPLIGAEINAISDGGYAYDTVTNDIGYYSIVDVVAETYDVFCGFPNYPTEVVEDVVVADGAVTTVDFALEGYAYWNDFENNDGGLVSNNANGWQWGAFTSGPMTGYSGTNGWGTVIGGNYPVSANFTLDTPVPFSVESPLAMLEFWHWYSTEESYDGGNVKVSADGGTSWSVITPLTGYTGIADASNPLNGQPIFTGHVQMFWELAQFDLSAYQGQAIIMRWHFGSDSSEQYAGWYIDDVSISDCSVPDQGWLEGTVTEFGTGNPIEGAVVTVGTGLSGTTLADGTYEITAIWPGDYDITCVAPLYLDAEELGFTIAEGANTLDFSLLWSEIAVDVTELISYLPPDETEIQTFIITNDGPGDLEYNISLDFPAEIRVVNSSRNRPILNTRENINSSEYTKTSKNMSNIRNDFSINDRDPNASNHNPGSTPTDDLFDWQFDWPVAVATGEGGIETDGNYIYTTEWNGAGGFFRYNMDGTYVGTFTIPGAQFVRDLAYDGQYFYGAAANNSLREMDFTPGQEALISTITAPVVCRAIAYDAVNDGFWANNWSDMITLFSRTGTVLNSFPCATWISYYGFAWEDVLPGGPYLWGYSQGGATLNQLVQIDIATGLETGVNFDVGSIFNVGTGIAGGLCISDAFIPGKWTLCGTSQNVNIWGAELADAENWVSITNNASGVVPANGGTIEVEVTFDATELLIGEEFTADLVIQNNSNYGDDYIIPVTLMVSGNIPPVNLNVNEATGLFTWDAPPGPDLLGYNVFLDDMTTFIGTTTDTQWQYEDLEVNQAYVAGVSAVYDDGESEIIEYPFTFVGTDAGDIIPLVTELRGNFPNPFNPVTNIAFTLSESGFVTLEVYNIKGQKMRTLVNSELDAGAHQVVWNGKEESGKSATSGVYFYKLKSANYKKTMKMILLK